MNNLRNALAVAVSDLCGAPRLKIKEQVDTSIPYKVDLDLDESEHAHNRPGWEGVVDKEPSAFSTADILPGRSPADVNEEVYSLV